MPNMLVITKDNSTKTSQEIRIPNSNSTDLNKQNDHFKILEQYKNALNVSSIVAITDSKGIITFVNDKFCEISKYSRAELLGKNHRILKSGFHSSSFYQNLWKTISSGKIWRGDIKNKAKDGSYYWVNTVIIPFLDYNGVPEQYLAIRVDITKQKEIEEQLTKSLKKLQKYEIARGEFLSMVSHELRTPLVPIQGYCDMLIHKKQSPKLSSKQISIINLIKKNTTNLVRLINDMLDVQKLDLEKIHYEYSTFNVKTFIKNFEDNIRPLLFEKEITFDTTFDDILINTDEQRLNQILTNLVRNSIDFVPKRGKITITIKKINNKILFSVEDNGIGIAPKQHEHIFDRYYQIDTSMSRKHGGSGLGLSICKGLIEGMRGKIWLKSKTDHGTTFYFIIPNDIS